MPSFLNLAVATIILNTFLDCVEVRALLLLHRQHPVMSACDDAFQASSMP